MMDDVESFDTRRADILRRIHEAFSVPASMLSAGTDPIAKVLSRSLQIHGEVTASFYKESARIMREMRRNGPSRGYAKHVRLMKQKRRAT